MKRAMPWQLNHNSLFYAPKAIAVKLFVLMVIILIPCIDTFSKGKLLLVGGGSEQPGGWSDDPYNWFVSQSANKRIAIISIDAGNDPDWLIEYFRSFGAAYAKNFEFPTKASTEMPGLYDSLMTYDGHFLKGGDQWLYYSYFKDSPVQEAIRQKFQDGGIVGGTSAGMAILGQYSYTAENESLLAYEGLENVFHPNITIEEDFLNLLPGFITDTHFLQRGRLPRLGSMMANYFLTTQKSFHGIAADDQTAICIDESSVATVFGDGGAYIYRDGDFEQIDDQWYGYQKGIHLSDGMQIDLTSFSILKGPELENAATGEENTNNEILLCGSNPMDENNPCVLQLAQQEDTLMILTGESRLVAANVFNSLKKLGKEDVFVLSAIADNNDSSLWKLRNRIRRTKTVVFIDNDFEGLWAFFKEGPTGALIREHITRDGINIAFFGKDCKLAGGRYCLNNEKAPDLAFQGKLEFADGLQLLSHSIIVPGAFDPGSEDFYENNTLSGLFALAADHLSFALYICSNSWIKLVQVGSNNFYEGAGRYSPVIIKNSASYHDTFEQNNGQGARNNASFDQLEIFTLNEDFQIAVGETAINEDPDYEFETPEPVITSLIPEKNHIKVFPTVTDQDILVRVDVDCSAELISITGERVRDFHLNEGDNVIAIDQRGVYLLRLFDTQKSTLIKLQKIIKY